MATDDTEDSVTPAAPSRLMSDVPTPSSYAEANSGRYASRWRDAMNEEIKSLQEHGTWELVERSKVPSRRKPTKSTWVYRVKLNRDGLKLCLQHFDVKSAFTQSDIDHEIYVDPPKGFEVLGVYVDDIILAHKNENDLKWFIDGFTGPDGFKSNHLGKLSWFLVLFVQNMLTDLNVEIKKPTVIFIDNQAAIKIAENLGVTARNKHFEDSIHFFRHQVDHRRVIPVHISTKLQKADGFTKLLDNSAFKLWKSNVVKFDTC
ncbi:hypothetical protein AB1Y20_012760 [Prymnesium parvum]|uniref:Reverse transcriptase Ty1/copia-type domain-containing protein n=1 Tax=Prymnesium parvum TaxID=97485 RepID=A0AB34ILL3_PRYPA